MKANFRNIASSLLLGWCLISVTSCKPEEPDSPSLETGTMTDIDGNVYQTVKIGDQWWMAENLKVGKYLDSSVIVKENDASDWAKDTVGAYCFYDANGVPTPGLLYNWHAVTNPKGLAPAGWHIPSDEEWKTMEKHLGMSPEEANKTNFRGIDEGGKLKKPGNDFWAPYSTVWSDNESGFSALAGNCRMFDGLWGNPSDLRSTGFWWTSTEHSSGESAWYRHLDYKKTNVFRYHGPKTYGFSVRCVKD